MSLAKKKAAFAVTLAMLMPTCWAAEWPSAANARQGPTSVTIDPDVVRLPVVEGHEIRFVRLRRSMGLSQQRVLQIAQDAHGFLWFGTQYGLDRYDGYRFKIFKKDPDDATSLCGASIHSLFTDRHERLWIGCAYALDRYDPATETFVHYRLAPPDSTGTPGLVRHISEDAAGILWVSTGDGLYRIDPATGATARFGHDKDDPFSLASNDVKSSGEDRAGTLWVATRDGLDAFDRKRGRVTEHVPLFESTDFSFYEDRQGTFWVLYGSGNGLAVLDRKTHRLTRYSFGREDLSIRPLTGASSMLEDRDGNLWIGTFSDGLLRFDREHRTFVHYGNDPSNVESLPENRITTLFEDRQGDIWLGFGTSEPAFFPIRPAPFEPLPFDSSDPANLGEAEVNAIYQDRAGTVWMGTTGALVRFDRQNGKLTHFAIPGGGIEGDVLALTGDTSGALWIGTSGQGLYRRSPSSELLTAFRHRDGDSTSLSDDNVFQVLVDHTGALWAATDDGLDRFNAANKTFTTYRFTAGGKRGRVQRIVEDSRGVLWVATSLSGVLRFDPQTERFENLSTARELGKVGRPGINGLLIDSTGDLWAATQNGLDRYNRQTGWVARYSEKDGLPSNAVSCILEDAAGGLWMGTSNGLSHLDRERKIFSNYSQADGLPGLDFTGYYGVCFRSPSGEMFFGGFAGAVAFRPDKLSDAAYVPPVVLTSFQLFGKPVPLAPGSPLKRVIEYTDQLTLSHDQSSFSFEFSALSFSNPATNRYRFKLEGLDRDWQEVASDRRYATYTTLPPGNYRFRVQGATIRGPWSEPGLAVQVTIEPAWWETWWFKIAVAVLVLLAMAALYALRVRQLHRQFAIRERARDTERARIARELHDTLLQSFQALLLRFQTVAALLPGRPAEAQQIVLSAVDQAAQAITEGRRAVQGLRTSMMETPDLAMELRTLGELAAAETHNEKVGLRVEVEGTPRVLSPLVRDEIYRIANEALRNAFRHAQASQVEVELRYDAHQLRLRIRDDGKGIDAKALNEGGDSATGGHYGLRGMRERAALVSAKLTLWTSPNSGTEVELTVPASRVYAKSRRQHRSWLARMFAKKGH